MSEALPPAGRSPFGERFDAIMDKTTPDGLTLPRCRSCGAWVYPVQGFCRRCLGEELGEEALSEPLGTLVSWTRIRASLEPWFRARLPWDVGLVRLDAGPNAIAHLGDGLARRSGVRARLVAVRDMAGRRVLVALDPSREVIRDPAPRLETLVAAATRSSGNDKREQRMDRDHE